MHPKTIEAFDAIGEPGDWKRGFQLGHDVTLEAKKKLIEKDKNKQTKILAVYRLRIEDNSEYILWQSEVSGHSAVGNLIKYQTGWDDECRWFEPIPTRELVYNPETQEHEERKKFDDLSQTIVHYLYPFDNKSNIEMIAKITKSNPRCQWYVRDIAGSTRVVPTFEEWSTKSFQYLIEPRKPTVTEAYH